MVFDRYAVTSSLKTFTRQKRQGGQVPVAYHITDTTNIAKGQMKQLLSHTTTKLELTAYLAERLLERAHQEEKPCVVAWGEECMVTSRNMSHLHSNHEEADTELVLHALDATASGATRIHVHSPDTDVLVLLLWRYRILNCAKTQHLSQESARTIVPSKSRCLGSFSCRKWC